MKTHLTRRETLQLLAAGLMVPSVPVFGAMRESVEYRRLGRTELEVSVVGFGRLSIGLASTDQHRVSQLLNQALDGDLNMIDTAECYGHPDKNHAEILIGNAIDSRRDEYILCSKVGHENGHFGQGGDWSPESIHRTMERFDLFADINHFRIPGTQWMGNQIIALGMLYYKMKDRFL